MSDAMLNHLLQRLAIIVLLAGPAAWPPAMRVCVEHLPAVNAALQRVQRLVATSPRWGNAVDRLNTTLPSRSARPPASSA